MNIVKDLRTLNSIAKKYHLEFNDKFKYYQGNAYRDGKGESLPHFFENKGRIFELVYVSGCFNPYLVELSVKNIVFDKTTNEPSFKNYLNPKWDKEKFYTV